MTIGLAQLSDYTMCNDITARHAKLQRTTKLRCYSHSGRTHSLCSFIESFSQSPLTQRSCQSIRMRARTCHTQANREAPSVFCYVLSIKIPQPSSTKYSPAETRCRTMHYTHAHICAQSAEHSRHNHIMGPNKACDAIRLHMHANTHTHTRLYKHTERT
jgi:hypothetical protein